MSHKDPITQEFVDQARTCAMSASRLESQIIDRIADIMTSIFKLFNQKDAYWYFDNEHSNLWDHYRDDQIDVSVYSCTGFNDIVILLEDGREWRLAEGIPTRWLFEDFEQELEEGKLKYIKKERLQAEDAKQKRVQKKEANLKLATIAKQKLTKEELKALRSVIK